MARPKKEPKMEAKAGQIVTFIGSMNQVTTGKLTKRKGEWMIETKDLYYFLKEVELVN